MNQTQRTCRFLTHIGLGISATAVLPGFVQAAEQTVERPNVIIILADDLGYGDVGCYNDESMIPTPNLDQLAKQGICLTDAHTPAAVCSPTRYGLLTGRYAWRSSLKYMVLWPWESPLIEEGRMTLASMLGQQGYHTACFGKWHLGWTWHNVDGQVIDGGVPTGAAHTEQWLPTGAQVDFTQPIGGGPLGAGFDYYFGDDVPNFPPYAFIENDHCVTLPSLPHKYAQLHGPDGPTTPGWDQTAVQPITAQHALRYLEERAEQHDGPFFMYLSLTIPHAPIATSAHYLGRSKAGLYGDLVCEADWIVGQVMAALDRLDLADNTLIIFTSDNGSIAKDGNSEDLSGKPMSVKARFGHDSNRPWRGRKGNIYEGGHRVPFIARWPGHIKPDTTSDETICLTDMMATFAAITGYELPHDAGEDSYNILPALLGEPYEGTLRPATVHHSGNGVFAIRQGKWKLIEGRGADMDYGTTLAPGEPGQLYDMQTDPGEQYNQYEQRPEIVKPLSDLLEQYKQTGRSRP